MFTYQVDPSQEGMTLLSFLRLHLKKEYSVKKIKRAIETKHCLINGKIALYSTISIKRGQKIVLNKKGLEKDFFSLPILYEDEQLVAIDKPSGLNSEEVPKLLKSKALLAHRLDKQTSGVLLLCKDKVTLELLKEAFFERTVEKSYLALVQGKVKEKEGMINLPLGPKKRTAGQIFFAPLPIEKGGRDALTQWLLVKRGFQTSLVRCFPKTGRTHQLRLHLKHIGHPILGDYQYNAPESFVKVANRLLLHAEQLIFKHPHLNKQVIINSNIPDEFSFDNNIFLI